MQIGNGSDTDQDLLILNRGGTVGERPRLQWEKGVMFGVLDGFIFKNPNGAMTLMANSVNDYSYLVANTQNNDKEAEILITQNTDPTSFTNLYGHAVGIAPTTHNPYLAYQRAADSRHYLDVIVSGSDISEVVINNDGANSDFRVEGDNNTNLIFTDAANDRVGIGTNTPAVTLDLSGTFQQSNAYLFLYKNAAQDLNSSWTDITWDNEVREDSLYSHATNSAEVTINANGWYLITAECAAELGSGTGRSHAEWRLVLDTGGGYTEIPGTIGGTYHRTDADDQSTMSITRLIELTNGDLLKLQGQDGGNDVQTMINGCRLFIERK